MGYKITKNTIASGMLALGSGRLTKKVKQQKCFILCHPAGHPVKVKGMFMVYSSRWQALATNWKQQYIVKRLILDL